MPDPQEQWVLVFSDGTGQRGVRAEAERRDESGGAIKNTNVFQLYAAADGMPGFKTFYDPGLGAPERGRWDWIRTLRNLWSKATGWGITANIVDCYEALMKEWKPGDKIGFFGFSRGAYTVRCLGGVLSTCGIAMNDRGAVISQEKKGGGADRRRAIAEEAVAAYKIKDNGERQKAGAAFAAKYGAAPVMPNVIGVFDTVKALGLPGITNMVNPFRHEFHSKELSIRVPVGLHALSIDENRREFHPILWDDLSDEDKASGQIIEQCWFPGVHSDVGGGYADNALSRLSLAWMLQRLEALCGLHIPMTVTVEGTILGTQHNERTGLGVLWWPGERTVRGQTVDIDALCVGIETRFTDYQPSYRPSPLAKHPRVAQYY